MASLRFAPVWIAAMVSAWVPPGARALDIVSGTGWLVTATDPGGLDWTLPGYDDTDWIAAFAPYPNWTPPQDFIPGTTAQYMWYWDSPASPSGGDGPLEAWFRYDLTLDASDLPADGRAAIVADDYFAFT